MKWEILDEVAFLFVEQYDDINGVPDDRSDAIRLRRAADGGEAALYAVVCEVFGDRINDAFVGAAYGAMDYIAYMDET